MNAQKPERRRYPRLPMVLLVMTKRYSDGSLNPGLLVDFSHAGTRLLTKVALHADEDLNVMVIARDGKVFNAMKAKVMWAKEGSFRYGFPRQYGISFTGTLDDETIREMIRTAQIPS